jgi:hypothetical protein
MPTIVCCLARNLVFIPNGGRVLLEVDRSKVVWISEGVAPRLPKGLGFYSISHKLGDNRIVIELSYLFMSNRDGFGSGFWLGTLFGGVVGGVIGATIANQRANRLEDDLDSGLLSGELGEKRPLKSRRLRTGDRMEIARRSLDDKISDLNSAIDAVRGSIGHTAENKAEPRIDGDLSDQKLADNEG